MSKSSSARRVIDLELNALKEQEELQSRLENLRRNAEQNEIADLQEKLVRKAAKRVLVSLASEVSHQSGLQMTI